MQERELNYEVVIIGGGLAGLINAIQLSKAGIDVCLVEKKQYPFQKVCGEYISNEVLPFLRTIDAYPDFIDLPQIKELLLSDTQGSSMNLPLPLGGFGISRYVFDEFLYQRAKKCGTTFFLNTQATDTVFSESGFRTTLSNGSILLSNLVIGAYGKRSKIDKAINRPFILRRSPYIGVKYHVKTDMPRDLIALHNFKNGYCGISSIEEGKKNLCYLSHRNNLSSGDIKVMEKEVLFRNPHLKRVFEEAEFLHEKPIVINEISFESKNPIEKHILMSGDAAGMITPLCGNGMAMAIHSAKILSSLIIDYYNSSNRDRTALEKAYTIAWNSNFKQRLRTGRIAQYFFGHSAASAFIVALAKSSNAIAKMIIRQTHGKPF